MTTADRAVRAPVSDSASRGDVPAWRPLAALLAVAGTGHLAMPKPWESIVPRALGEPGPWVKASGVAELLCAAGLAVPRTRRVAALASAALFVGVFPANIQMAVTGLRSPKASPVYKAGVLARLPLQVPLVTRSLRIARATREPR